MKRLGLELLAGFALAVVLAACGGSAGSGSSASTPVSPGSVSACLERLGLHVVDGGPPAHNNESAAPSNFHRAAQSTAIDEVYVYVALPNAGEPPDTTIEVFPDLRDATAAAATGGGSGYTTKSMRNIAWSESSVDAARIGGDIRQCARE